MGEKCAAEGGRQHKFNRRVMVLMQVATVQI